MTSAYKGAKIESEETKRKRPQETNLRSRFLILFWSSDVFSKAPWCFFDAVPDGIIGTKWTIWQVDAIVSASKLFIFQLKDLVPERKTPKNTGKKKPKPIGLDFLAGAGGFEPATHGFGVALKACEALIFLAFSPVSEPFSRKTVCRSCVWIFLMLFWCSSLFSPFILSATAFLMLLTAQILRRCKQRKQDKKQTTYQLNFSHFLINKTFEINSKIYKWQYSA